MNPEGGRQEMNPHGESERSPVPPRNTDDVISIGFATTISVLAVVYASVSHIALLVAWEVVAVVYLVLLFTKFHNRSAGQARQTGRVLPARVLEYLSWVLPIAASATGVTSAVILLTTEGSSGTGNTHAVATGFLGSAGVIVAWLLLQTGFAEIYESVYERLPESSMIRFPGVGTNPTLGDFLYLSFMVGTSFSPEGAIIASRKVRRVVLVHSVTSFFYNAFLIAIAIQVLRGIIASG